MIEPSTPPVTAQQVSSNMNTIMKEPPNYAIIHGNKRDLTQYIAALKLWARVSGVEKRDQADYVKYHAYQTVPEYFKELDAKFGDSLTAREDGLTKIIKFLEEKFEVSQHSKIVHKLNEFYSCSRQKSEDLVKYTARFEQTYKEATRIKVAGDKAIMNYSSTALAVLLLRTANLSDADHQIISCSLNFDKAKKEEEEKTFERIKAAIISHQVSNSGHNNKYAQGQGRGSRGQGRGRGGGQDTENSQTDTKVTELKDDTEKKCFICSRVRMHDNREPPTSKHLVRIKSGNVLPDSCPHMIELPMEQKREFLQKYNICPVCCFNDLTSSHTAETCKHTQKFPAIACEAANCNIRFSLCAKHKARNEERLRTKKTRYDALGLSYNIDLEETIFKPNKQMCKY